MNSYRVHWLYVRTDRKRPVKGDVVVIAETAEQAREAFMATHPDGAVFHYAITEVEALAAGDLFDMV